MGTLYIVATPIGNLEDITIRAIKTLLTADVICAEDTRHTGQLLKILREKYAGSFDIQANVQQRLFSYYDEVEEKKVPEVIDLLQQGKSVALVSDAGTPLISDPGYKLINACIKQAIPVTSVPGPSSVTAALSVSGLPTDQFLFLGYLSASSHKRKNQLTNLFRCFDPSKTIHPSVVLFESSHRLTETLADIREVFGDREIVIARELTKIHEQIIHAKISAILADTPVWKGELVLLFRLTVQAE